MEKNSDEKIPMSLNSLTTSPSYDTRKVEAYQIEIPIIEPKREEESASRGEKIAMMVVRCRACGKTFDTTFTVEDFQRLPRDQIETGTLHLCPYCGNLSLYMMHEYSEQEK